MKKKSIPCLTGLLAAALVATGCATSASVDQKVSAAQAANDKKIESVEAQLEQMQEKQKATETKVQEHGKLIEELGQSAADALKRAQEAGVLAKGKVVFQESFAEDRVRFKVDSYKIGDDARKALDEFAGKVKALDRPIYLEIQGHTDSTGSPNRNELLGQQRADAVRFYLSKEHKVPLNRMSTISYGDTLPLEKNNTSAGRSKNRRVVIVVLE